MATKPGATCKQSAPTRKYRNKTERSEPNNDNWPFYRERFEIVNGFFIQLVTALKRQRQTNLSNFQKYHGKRTVVKRNFIFNNNSSEQTQTEFDERPTCEKQYKYFEFKYKTRMCMVSF